MYKISKTGLEIIRLSDLAFIPVDANNSAYKAYLEWCNNGGIAEPYKTPQELADEEIEKNNAIIKQQLLEEDLKIIRALVENDQARINAFKQEQSARRKKLVPPGE